MINDQGMSAELPWGNVREGENVQGKCPKAFRDTIVAYSQYRPKSDTYMSWADCDKCYAYYSLRKASTKTYFEE